MLCGTSAADSTKRREAAGQLVRVTRVAKHLDPNGPEFLVITRQTAGATAFRIFRIGVLDWLTQGAGCTFKFGLDFFRLLS